MNGYNRRPTHTSVLMYLKIFYKNVWIAMNCIWFFSTHAWKRPFFCVEKWIENRIFRAFVKVSSSSGRKRLFLPLYDDSIYSISHSLFMQKRSYSCTYKKSTMCNKGTIDLFRLGWWFWALVCHSGARVHHLCSIIILVRKRQFSSLVAQCTIYFFVMK